jgi:8-oxo-dGTP pyrophosphatase MutT (NUDIX family)
MTRPGRGNESQQDGDRWYPHLTVASIINIDGKYLMVRENGGSGAVINQPAGHVEQGESLVEAVIRETREETGWLIEPEYICGIYQFVAGNGETYLRFTYSGKLIEQCRNLALDPAIEEVLWLDRATLECSREMLRSQVVLQCITDFEMGNQLPLDCVQELESVS